jgi:hypothetical protein
MFGCTRLSGEDGMTIPKSAVFVIDEFLNDSICRNLSSECTGDQQRRGARDVWVGLVSRHFLVSSLEVPFLALHARGYSLYDMQEFELPRSGRDDRGIPNVYFI